MTHSFNAPGLTLWQRLVAPQGFIAAVLVVTASKFVLFDANLKGLKYDLLVVPLLLAAYWIGESIARGAIGCCFTARSRTRPFSSRSTRCNAPDRFLQGCSSQL
jgi:hypothetical protein